MKYAASLLFITAATTITLFADSNTMPSATQRISNFLSGGLGPNFNQAMPATAPSNFSFSGNNNNGSDSNFQFSSSDFASLFSSLSSAANDHHFDPNSLNNLQSVINNLHLDPALLSNVQTFVQNLQNGTSPQCDNNSGSDQNSNNDNSGSDENSNNNNDNSGSDENADNNNNDNSGSDENADNENDNEGDNENIEDMDDDNPVQVPEPSTFALMAAGAGLLAGTFLRRRTR